jgi:hypothetical protein
LSAGPRFSWSMLPLKFPLWIACPEFQDVNLDFAQYCMPRTSGCQIWRFYSEISFWIVQHSKNCCQDYSKFRSSVTWNCLSWNLEGSGIFCVDMMLPGSWSLQLYQRWSCQWLPSCTSQRLLWRCSIVKLYTVNYSC